MPLADALVIYFAYVWQTIEDCEERFEDVKELLALVTKTLPLPPNLPNSEEEIIEGKEEIENGEQHKVEPMGEEQNKQGIDDGNEETVAGEQMETSWGHMCTTVELEAKKNSTDIVNLLNIIW